MEATLNVSVFGIGYVGAVSAACLAREGHFVVAADSNVDKVNTINDGASPIVEPGLDELIQIAVEQERLRATTSAAEAVAATNVSIVCVGTPSRSNGSLDTSYVARVAENIGTQIKKKNDFHSVVVRSTTVPGTTESVIVPNLERTSGRKAGSGFGIAYFPEFLREGSAITDFERPGAVVVGVEDELTYRRITDMIPDCGVEPKAMSIKAAEAVKYADNAWHALKISFANELGLISKALGIDSYDVMEALCADKKLNISPAYLMPGFAFGGSCLPKDLNALRYAAKCVDLETPVLDAVLRANDNQLNQAYRMIEETGKRRIGLIGLSFKPGTDDLRYSPYVELAERLIGRGFQVKIYDPTVRLSRLTGANRQYISQRLPHIADLLLEDVDELIKDSDVVVVGNGRTAVSILDRIVDAEKVVIDLVRIDRRRRTTDQYHGICW
jgi:GDP-mannose 6-dehydrogenase